MPNTYTTLSSLFTAIANAIRSKLGTSTPIVADDFPTQIGNIETDTDVSDTTATASDVLSGKAFYLANGTKTQGSIASKPAQTYTPTTADQTIAAGQYLSGAQTVKGDANLIAENIKKDVTIFGVTGTYEGGGGGGVVYGFHVDSSESDPSNCVTYLEDAVGLTPAAMNFSTGVFSYGSWANAFFMPRPCMLKYDGTVDYYLDPDDFAKKADGTASDVADDTYGGNAMIEWGDGITKIWMKCVPDTGNPASGSVYISNQKLDDDYHCYPFINNQGDEVMHFYTPIYGGSIDSNGKLRSLSGKTLAQSKTMTKQSTAARANNPGDSVLWDIENLAERMLINALLILMGKSLNTQAVFGNGRQGQASSATSLLTTGTLNDKGLFWGASDNSHDVKVFGMSWWGNQWHRVNGYLLVDGVMKVKMTHGRQDGTTADDYNQTGSGYISLGSLSAYRGYFQTTMTFNSLGFFPQSAGGPSASSTTFWCDPIWTNTSGAKAALVGGSADYAAGTPGAFFVDLLNEPAFGYWSFGAAPSCKPLAP